MSALPLSVVTGFLGSGKTTLIRRLLADPRLRGTAVIVNEFGEVGLDHELVESSEEDLVELSTGCLCCASRGDLSRAVGRLLARRTGGAAIERIVVETTGLADPAPILQSMLVDPVLREGVRLARVVVTVDAVAGDRTLDAHPVSRKQAALADMLLVTKTDIAGGAAGGIEARLHALNPEAEVRTVVDGVLDPDAFLQDRVREPASRPERQAHAHHHPHDDITSVSLVRAAPLHAVSLTLFLQALADCLGPDLLRVKGIVAVAESPDTPAVVHGVQHVFHPVAWLEEWPAAERCSRIVLIGRGVERGWVEALLDTIEEEVAGV